ncbi:MAG: hypothetical protein K6T65_10355 [Peptococcaceae bacterium]|nr:hypothetical protein [Peptococcaceae bacterium]
MLMLKVLNASKNVYEVFGFDFENKRFSKAGRARVTSDERYWVLTGKRNIVLQFRDDLGVVRIYSLLSIPKFVTEYIDKFGRKVVVLETTFDAFGVTKTVKLAFVRSEDETYGHTYKPVFEANFKLHGILI